MIQMKSKWEAKTRQKEQMQFIRKFRPILRLLYQSFNFFLLLVLPIAYVSFLIGTLTFIKLIGQLLRGTLPIPICYGIEFFHYWIFHQLGVENKHANNAYHVAFIWSVCTLMREFSTKDLSCAIVLVLVTTVFLPVYKSKLVKITKLN